MVESANMVLEALERMPAVPRLTTSRDPAIIASAIEGTRGTFGSHHFEDSGGINVPHCWRRRTRKNPYRVSIRSPMFITIPYASKCMIGYKVADIPAIMGSFDLVGKQTGEVTTWQAAIGRHQRMDGFHHWMSRIHVKSYHHPKGLGPLERSTSKMAPLIQSALHIFIFTSVMCTVFATMMITLIVFPTSKKIIGRLMDRFGNTMSARSLWVGEGGVTAGEWWSGLPLGLGAPIGAINKALNKILETTIIQNPSLG